MAAPSEVPQESSSIFFWRIPTLHPSFSFCEASGSSQASFERVKKRLGQRLREAEMDRKMFFLHRESDLFFYFLLPRRLSLLRSFRMFSWCRFCRELLKRDNAHWQIHLYSFVQRWRSPTPTSSFPSLPTPPFPQSLLKHVGDLRGEGRGGGGEVERVREAANDGRKIAWVERRTFWSRRPSYTCHTCQLGGARGKRRGLWSPLRVRHEWQKELDNSFTRNSFFLSKPHITHPRPLLYVAPHFHFAHTMLL